jgi:YbbR domain-containing protein
MVWQPRLGAGGRSSPNPTQIDMARRDYILHNFWWKLLSLLLAALTWLTIQTEFEKDQDLRETPVMTSSARIFPAIPINLLGAPGTLKRYKLDPATVSVEVSGSADELSRLREQDIFVYVDIRNAGDEKQFRRTIQAHVPHDMSVEHLSPFSTRVERISSSTNYNPQSDQ